MAIPTAAMVPAAVTVPLAVFAVTVRPAGRPIRLLTRSLTVIAARALTAITGMLLRGDNDAGAIRTLRAARGTICAVTAVNTRRLHHQLQQLRTAQAQTLGSPSGKPAMIEPPARPGHR